MSEGEVQVLEELMVFAGHIYHPDSEMMKTHLRGSLIGLRVSLSVLEIKSS